ncbi:toll-like receptor 2 [Mercenaria mercenaria]|uniref:toll-like receptor 2 n=1 Tax=Mercenaria mercenaria TaxID=6596 RepID=UPI00234ED2FD|nr:toll-like receptor 2 [Mercenaria mercenaria]
MKNNGKWIYLNGKYNCALPNRLDRKKYVQEHDKIVFKMLFFFILLMVRVCISSAMSPQGNCVVANEIMTCEHTFPTKMQLNVTTVVIKDYRGQNIVNTTFTDISWSKVSSLDITVNEETYFGLDENNFIKLKMNLIFLGIHAPRLSSINRHSFRELLHLQTLDLSHSVLMNQNELIASILGSELRLTALNLNYISSSKPLLMDQNFMQMIAKTKTERLRLSGSNLILKGPLDVANLTFEISYLNISNISVAVTNLKHSNEVKSMAIFLENLKDLDMSYIKSRFLELNYNFLQNNHEVHKCDTSTYFGMITKAQNAFLNGVWQTKIYGNNSVIDLSACIINVKSLHLKRNNMLYLNVTIKWPQENDLKTIDLSENGMEYLNPDFFIGLTSLDFIDLSGNKLGFMERLKEFSSLLANFRDLRHCNMSHNKITFIPKLMFTNNAKIVELDLSSNDLTSVTFDLEQFTDIRLLWLKNNRFKFLNERDFTKLDFLMQLRNNVINIDITGNPLECSCKSTKFLKWISSKLQPCTNHFYQCQIEGQTHSIDETVIEEAKYLCVRTAIIIILTCITVAIIVAILSLAVFLYFRVKRNKRKQAMNTFLRGLGEGILSQKYLCFLSFSSNEDGNLITELGGSIDENLKRLTGIAERSLVCKGDFDFRPGYPVVNEIFRMVNRSYVMVCLVSKEFCASKWCDLELRYAYENNKPIILIFKEKVQGNEMTTLLHNIFITKIRAKLIIEEEEYRLIPGYDILSESIFELALNGFVHNDRTTSNTLLDGETSNTLLDGESSNTFLDGET